MSKIIKMEMPPGQGKKEKLLAIFQKILEVAKAKLVNKKEPQPVPEKYTFKTFIKAVLNDLITIAVVIVIGGIIGACIVVVVLYTLIENTVIHFADRVKARRKRSFKMKKV